MGGNAAEFLADIIPLRRFGTKADIGLTAVFLARCGRKLACGWTLRQGCWC